MPDPRPRPNGWPTTKHLARLLRSTASLAVTRRRPDLWARLERPTLALWALVPANVRAPARALLVQTAPGAASVLAGAPVIVVRTAAGQDTPAPPPVDALSAAIRDWNQHLETATSAADALWTAATVARSATEASALAAAQNPDGALDAARDGFTTALAWEFGGGLLLVAAAVGALFIFGRR